MFLSESIYALLINMNLAINGTRSAQGIQIDVWLIPFDNGPDLVNLMILKI